MLGEVRIKRGIFQGDILSPLLFVIALIPLIRILRKSKAGYEFSKSREVNHLYSWMTLSCMRKIKHHWTP